MNKIKIFCDGGARGNPGPAGIGFVAKRNNEILMKYSLFIGKATNNVAEYTAVLKAMQWLNNEVANVQPSGMQQKNTEVVFYLDSLLVVKQLGGYYKIKNLALQKLAEKIKSIESKLKLKIKYVHIPREENFQADQLANLAMDSFKK